MFLFIAVCALAQIAASNRHIHSPLWFLRRLFIPKRVLHSSKNFVEYFRPTLLEIRRNSSIGRNLSIFLREHVFYAIKWILNNCEWREITVNIIANSLRCWCLYEILLWVNVNEYIYYAYNINRYWRFYIFTINVFVYCTVRICADSGI